MYTNMLVPLDGSLLSEGILPYASTLAKALNVPVELLQVINPEIIGDSVDPQIGRYFDIIEADMKRKSNDYLDSVAGSLPSSLTVNRLVETGNAAEVIVDRAASGSGTLIAMSTHGRSGIQRWVLGSVADKVLHASSNPLLLVRARDEGRTVNESTLKTIVVPLDGSALAELAIPHVVVVAKKMKLEVILLRVCSLAREAYMGEGYPPDFDRITVTVKKEIKDYLEGKVSQLRAEGIENISYLLPEGDAAAQITDIAMDIPDNLVAMCTHGRSGIGRWMLGSVTDRVVRHSGHPVLVIRSRSET
jgi:nucleotide-binding universal stress UspA family protein